MENDFNKLKQDVEQLKRELEETKRSLAQHNHLGSNGNRIDFFDLVGHIRTITVAGDLTNILASKPRTIYEQILIDNTTGTKKLYVYDMDSGGIGWKSVTIA